MEEIIVGVLVIGCLAVIIVAISLKGKAWQDFVDRVTKDNESDE
ncbi:hypothetical protein [Claveliimonas monacensis]|nr:hypothetical protein [Claveliimonas monacensis]